MQHCLRRAATHKQAIGSFQISLYGGRDKRVFGHHAHEDVIKSAKLVVNLFERTGLRGERTVTEET